MDFSHPRPNGVQAGRASFIQHPIKLQFPLKEGKIRSRDFIMDFQIKSLARISPPRPNGVQAGRAARSLPGCAV